MPLTSLNSCKCGAACAATPVLKKQQPNSPSFRSPSPNHPPGWSSGRRSCTKGSQVPRSCWRRHWLGTWRRPSPRPPVARPRGFQESTRDTVQTRVDTMWGLYRSSTVGLLSFNRGSRGDPILHAVLCACCQKNLCRKEPVPDAQLRGRDSEVSGQDVEHVKRHQDMLVRATLVRCRFCQAQALPQLGTASGVVVC